MVPEELSSLEVHSLDGLSLRDLREEAVEAAVIAADRVGAEVMVGVADDGHAEVPTSRVGKTIGRREND